MNNSMWKAMEYARDGMFVPPALTNEILDKVGSNKKQSVLVLFSYEMLPILQERGYKDVTLVTDSPRKSIRNLCDKYEYTVKTTKDYEEDKVDVDVLLGNPPYQNVDKKNKNAKLWYDFSVSALKYNAEVIAFVTPEAAFKDIDSNGRRMRKLMSESGYGLKEFERHHGKWFDVGVETSHWIIEKGNPTSIESGVFTYTSQTAIDICDKVVSYPKKLKMWQENDTSNSDIVENGKYEFYRSGKNKSRTNKKLNNSGKKVLFPFSASYKSLFYTEECVSGLNKIVNVNSKKEGRIIEEYCLSDLFIFVANRYRKTSGFCPFVKNQLVPDLRGEDTSDLYSLFGLTKEEIEYIESNK